MIERYKNKKNIPDILIVYNHMPDGRIFHRHVARKLQTKNMQNVRYAEYNNRTNIGYHNFIEKHLLADYVINLSDAYENEREGIPCYFSVYNDSKMELSKKLKIDFWKLGDHLEKFVDKDVGAMYINTDPQNSGEKYPKFVVELFPEQATIDEAVMQMDGFISILQSNPHGTRKAKKPACDQLNLV